MSIVLVQSDVEMTQLERYAPGTLEAESLRAGYQEMICLVKVHPLILSQCLFTVPLVQGMDDKLIKHLLHIRNISPIMTVTFT